LHSYRFGVHSFQQQNTRAGVTGCRVPVRIRQTGTFKEGLERAAYKVGGVQRPAHCVREDERVTFDRVSFRLRSPRRSLTS